jgi:uncharacterized membrane protein (DUF485 family)
MSDRENIQKHSSFFLEGLALLFIYLKLTGQIAWSWWWVLSPIWGSFVVVFTILAVGALIAWKFSR